MKVQFSDTNSKDIWDNHLLCAQFLRNYSGVSLLEDIQPEDITDETEKLRPFMGVEFAGDAVKKVHVHRPGDQPVYVVALLEHKSTVDYDITLQLLKYMVGIWIQYRNERNSEHSGTSTTKNFRYPLVIPIVYYEGKQPWTAAMRWGERVEFGESFPEYVPDFTYQVISLNRYTRKEILSKENEMSLVMLFNRIQSVEDMDITRWSKEDQETARRILAHAPEKVVELLAQMIYHFGQKIHASKEEIIDCVHNMEEKDMGVLWENMEKMDIQAERRNTSEARERLAETEQELGEALETIAEKDQTIAEKDQTIAALEAKVKELENQS